MSRAPKQPIIYQEKLKLPKELTRFATPKEPAIYRAKKLSCKTIVEIGAGIGGQTIAFAKTCKKVIAIEINKKDAKVLQENLKKLRIKNVDVIIGDALNEKVIEFVKLKNPEIIFCDSARKPQGERFVKDIEPDLKKLIEKYSKLTTKIAIEIPPFTQDTHTLGKNFEKEFISLNKQLNRLTLYFNELKKNEVSVIELPSKEKIFEKEKSSSDLKKETSVKNYKYIYELSPAIALANMENNLAIQFNANLIGVDDKTYLISKNKLNSSFLTEYEIEKITENEFKKVIDALKESDVKNVILKYKISPEEYWQERKKYEKELNGNETKYLFLNKKEAIICKKSYPT